MPKPRMPQTPEEFQMWADLYPPQPGSKGGKIDKKELYNRETDFFDWEQEQGEAMVAALERRGQDFRKDNPEVVAANDALYVSVEAERNRRFSPAERKALDEMSRERSWGLVGDGTDRLQSDVAQPQDPTKVYFDYAGHPDTKAPTAPAKAAKSPAPVPTPTKKPTPPQAVLRQKAATSKMAGPEPATKPEPTVSYETDSWEMPVGLPEEAGIRTVATPEELRRKAANERAVR